MLFHEMQAQTKQTVTLSPSGLGRMLSGHKTCTAFFPGVDFILTKSKAFDRSGARFARGLGPLAQLVEHLTFNQRVAGSTPARLTTKKFRQREKTLGVDSLSVLFFGPPFDLHFAFLN